MWAAGAAGASASGASASLDVVTPFLIFPDTRLMPADKLDEAADHREENVLDVVGVSFEGVSSPTVAACVPSFGFGFSDWNADAVLSAAKAAPDFRLLPNRVSASLVFFALM